MSFRSGCVHNGWRGEIKRGVQLPGWFDDLALLLIKLLASRCPVFRGELEDACDRPMGREPQDLLEIRLRVQTMQCARCDQRSEDGVPTEAGAIVEERPV